MGAMFRTLLQRLAKGAFHRTLVAKRYASRVDTDAFTDAAVAARGVLTAPSKQDNQP